MANINQLPYFQINNTKETNEIARFLLKKIKKLLREKCPYHYLIFARQDKRLKYIQKLSKKYKYFLKIDIEKYYPSVNHKILLNNLLIFRGSTSKYSNLQTRRVKHYFKYEIPKFLKQSPIKDRGLPLGNYLGWVLSGFYLLPLELEKLKLKLNINKLNSGKFHQNPVEFMGFRYYAGIFTISKKKIEEFKNRIVKITHLTKKKSYKAIIKLLNNKILGFGHYYKFTHCKQDFEKLDSFIRQRLRRYLIKNKNQKQKIGNLLLTNQQLENLGLKSLVNIKTKYASKKRYILRKTNKKKKKIIPDNYWQKAVLKHLQELAKNVKQIKNKLGKIEKKLKNS